ncbi:MAG: helix-turn-helix transcriptional regulator [Rhizobiales bacterium]|nr:helix-turn-helix transcriptional regulator [Hyphomicrobiales bacterium]
MSHNQAKNPVLQTMMTYSKASLVDVKRVNKHVTLSLWDNENDFVEYQNSKFHTLSLYMKGGHDNYRLDKNIINKSGENKLCLMPAGQKSVWEIGHPFKLAHFYFTDEYLKTTAMQVFDIDPREVFLQDLSFEDNQALSSLLRHSIFQTDWRDIKNHHFIDHAIQMVILYLLQNYTNNRFSLPKISGGLSRKNQSLIQDYIISNLDQRLSLAELSEKLNLSEYHFAHMFKQSFALPPHQFIQQARVDKAATQIKSKINSFVLFYNNL